MTTLLADHRCVRQLRALCCRAALVACCAPARCVPTPTRPHALPHTPCPHACRSELWAAMVTPYSVHYHSSGVVVQPSDESLVWKKRSFQSGMPSHESTRFQRTKH